MGRTSSSEPVRLSTSRKQLRSLFFYGLRLRHLCNSYSAVVITKTRTKTKYKASHGQNPHSCPDLKFSEYLHVARITQTCLIKLHNDFQDTSYWRHKVSSIIIHIRELKQQTFLSSRTSDCRGGLDRQRRFWREILMLR